MNIWPVEHRLFQLEKRKYITKNAYCAGTIFILRIRRNQLLLLKNINLNVVICSPLQTMAESLNMMNIWPAEYILGPENAIEYYKCTLCGDYTYDVPDERYWLSVDDFIDKHQSLCKFMFPFTTYQL